MAFELYGMLAGNVSPMTGENVKPAYGGEEEAFLRKVVSPIYEVIAKVLNEFFELYICTFCTPFRNLSCVPSTLYHISLQEAERSKRGSKHSQWRNYDDLNEYFWYYTIFFSLFCFWFIFILDEFCNNLLVLYYRSVDCFRLGWPMRADADFFCLPFDQLQFVKNGVSYNWSLYNDFLLFLFLV